MPQHGARRGMSVGLGQSQERLLQRVNRHCKNKEIWQQNRPGYGAIASPTLVVSEIAISLPDRQLDKHLCGDLVVAGLAAANEGTAVPGFLSIYVA